MNIIRIGIVIITVLGVAPTRAIDTALPHTSPSQLQPIVAWKLFEPIDTQTISPEAWRWTGASLYDPSTSQNFAAAKPSGLETGFSYFFYIDGQGKQLDPRSAALSGVIFCDFDYCVAPLRYRCSAVEGSNRSIRMAFKTIEQQSTAPASDSVIVRSWNWKSDMDPIDTAELSGSRAPSR